MKRGGIQLSGQHKRWFYSITVLLLASGALWILADYLAGREASRAHLFRLVKSRSLQVHGAAAMAFLVALGILIPTHIQRAWHANRNRPNGVLTLGVVTALIITGYGLYYSGDEQWRGLASWLHWVAGIGTPGLLGLHIWVGRRSR